MEPYEINLSLVAGTAGMYAIAWSEDFRRWDVLHIEANEKGERDWLWVDSHSTQDGARKLAYARYALSLAQEATQ